MGKDILDEIVEIKEENTALKKRCKSLESRLSTISANCETLKGEKTGAKRELSKLENKVNEMTWKEHLEIASDIMKDFEIRQERLSYSSEGRNYVTGCDAPEDYQINTGRM